MQVKGGYILEQAVVDVAKMAKQINLSKESRFLIPSIKHDLQDLVS